MNPVKQADLPLVHFKDFFPWLILGTGLLALYLPTFLELITGLWLQDSQGHGPIVLGISVWLFIRKAKDVHSLKLQPSRLMGWMIFSASLLTYVIGRSQNILIAEVGSLIGIITALLLLMRGAAAFRLVWFAIFFMIFMVPLPGGFVDSVTQPMKMLVSNMTELILRTTGYPISRQGVVLYIGQYQLLVADACAGLHTLFTLEAMGLLYLNIVRYSSVMRNALLAMLIVPIGLTANTIRVVTLVLITYYFGDEAGQGFMHGFAGMVLFFSALLLIIGLDSTLRWKFKEAM